MKPPTPPHAVRPASGDARAVVENLAAWAVLRTLVAFDTTGRESNLALIDCVRGWLWRDGVVPTLTDDDDCRKANLFATLPARDGPAGPPQAPMPGRTA